MISWVRILYSVCILLLIFFVIIYIFNKLDLIFEFMYMYVSLYLNICVFCIEWYNNNNNGNEI